MSEFISNQHYLLLQTLDAYCSLEIIGITIEPQESSHLYR